MGRISATRVIAGGVVAGIVADLIGFIVDGVWLAPRWNAALKALGHAKLAPNQWIGFDLLGIACGLVAVWLYAAMRPRFGPGMVTAVKAGGAVWIVGALFPNLEFMYLAGLFPRWLTLYTTVGGLFEIVIGTIAGAIVYREALGETEASLAAIVERVTA